MGATLPAKDPVGDLAESPIQPNAAELCFVDGIDEEPSVLVGGAPFGEAGPFCRAKCPLKTILAHIFDRSEERELAVCDPQSGLFAHFLCFSATCFSEHNDPTPC